MAIGRRFEEAFLKAWSSLEYGSPHPRPLTMADASGGETNDERSNTPLSDETLEEWLTIPSDSRMGALFEAFRRGWGIEKVRELTGGVTRWFLHRFQIMATIEGEILDYGENNKVADLDEGRIRRWKGYGFSDAHISLSLIHI